MISRREFLQAAAAASALTAGAGYGNWSKLAAQQSLTQSQLMEFAPFGNVTLVHLADIHAQLMPTYFREPSVNLGVGEATGKPPHVTAADFLKLFNLKPGSRQAYALTSDDFVSLARGYGKMGGFDRIATVVKAIRAEREANMLFLDGGDTWQGSYTANKTNGQDMITAMNSLKPDAMTGHWEFTYGTDRVREVVDALPYPFLAGNIFDNEWQEPAFESTKFFERGGIKIAVIGQAFPYTPIANPRWMIPNWSMGIREETIQKNVDAARVKGAGLVVLLSHNGFDVDRKLVSRVKGIDVVLTAHTHDAIPEPLLIGKTLLVASGSNGKFISRLDLDVSSGTVKGFRYKLIPIFSDVITPDKETTRLVDDLRAPYKAELERVVGTTESLLYRRGNFNGTFDDLICQALLAERDAEIALSPGFRWGPSLLPGQPIRVEDIFNATAITYPATYRIKMTGARMKEVLEDVADNLFNTDPYYQQGGDMVRVGGLGYTITPKKPIGSRISNMTLLRTMQPLDASREYAVAGWASINQDTQGPPIWGVVESYIAARKTVSVSPNDAVKVVG
jgi:sulfur-oxidizing protein SoxB